MTDITAPAEAEANVSRGRPRPQDTIARDQHVYDVLLAHGSAATRDQIAKLADVKPSHAYLSLIRLRRAGLAQRATSGDAQSHAWEALTK